MSKLPVLLESGENLALANSDLFIHQENLRKVLRTRREEAETKFSLWQPPQTFLRFKKLAPELRRMVWHYTAAQPRLFEVKFFAEHEKIESQFRSRTPVPGILHASHEARACGLEVYQKVDFGANFNNTFINWEVDFVLFELQQALKPFLMKTDSTHSLISAYSGLINRPQHSIFNTECRNLVIHDQDLETFKAGFRPHLFPKLKDLILLHTPKQMGTVKEGCLALVQVPSGTDKSALSKQMEVLQKHPRQLENVCIMSVVRERHRLKTVPDQGTKDEVKQVSKKVADTKVPKAKKAAGKKQKAEVEAQLDAERKQLQYEQDMLLAAQYVLSWILPNIDRETKSLARLQLQNP